MKKLFFILLVVNLLFFGIIQLASNRVGELGKEHQPLNSRNISIVPAIVENSPESIVLPSTATKERVCLEWGTFTGKNLEQAVSALKALNLDEGQLSQLNVAETNRYWVYIPPLKSRADAEKKLSELQVLDVSDFLLIQDGKWKFAISLGVFATEEAAVKFLAQLQKKGVRSAKSGPRQHETGEVKFQLRNVSDELASKLVVLKEGFQQSALKAVACQN